MGQKKDVIADAAVVAVMHGDAEVCLIVEQPVDDVGGLAGGRNGNRVVRGCRAETCV